VFGLHDHNQFEVTVYALCPTDHSQWRLKIEAEAHRFKDISQARRMLIIRNIFEILLRPFNRFWLELVMTLTVSWFE